MLPQQETKKGREGPVVPSMTFIHPEEVSISGEADDETESE